MHIEKIHSEWGEIWSLSKDELFSLPFSFFRNKIYERRLIIIKSVGDLLLHEIYYLMDKFGKPWPEEKYILSKEHSITKEYKNQQFVITSFNNDQSLNQKIIPNDEMAWHADIPNDSKDPFPIRLLYMNKQPSSSYGKTRWLNIDLDFLNLEVNDLEYFKNCSVVQQSWHNKGDNIQNLNFIKSHPIIPDRKSLRLNFYFKEEDPNTHGAWILKSFYKNEQISNENLIGNTIKKILKNKNLIYEHQWNIGDIAIFDNWSFLHGRSALLNYTFGVREFIRGNMDHQNLEDFNNKGFFLL